MSADLLREAAVAMRDRAEASTAFTDARTGAPLAWVRGLGGLVFDNGAAPIASAVDAPTAGHIASWHPAVALAVADWLDLTAERWETPAAPTYPLREAALVTARTYLGIAS